MCAGGLISLFKKVHTITGNVLLFVLLRKKKYYIRQMEETEVEVEMQRRGEFDEEKNESPINSHEHRLWIHVA